MCIPDINPVSEAADDHGAAAGGGGGALVSLRRLLLAPALGAGRRLHGPRIYSAIYGMF